MVSPEKRGILIQDVRIFLQTPFSFEYPAELFHAYSHWFVIVRFKRKTTRVYDFDKTKNVGRFVHVFLRNWMTFILIIAMYDIVIYLMLLIVGLPPIFIHAMVLVAQLAIVFCTS